MSTRRILLQLDPDSHASVFDAVVAIDSQVDHLLQYAGVEAASVRGIGARSYFYAQSRRTEEHCAVHRRVQRAGWRIVAEGRL